MKPSHKILLLIIFRLFIQPDLAHSQWTWLNPKYTINSLNDVAFIDSLKGYIAGDNGTLLKTMNSGTDWEIIDTDTNLDLTCIFKVNPSVIYIGGEHGLIMKSMNGGDYWRYQDSGYPLRINSIWFTSVDTGYAVGPVGAILRTFDGAETWEMGSLGQWTEFFSVCFTSEDTGFIAGRSGKLYRTSNGGESWHLCDTGSDEILYSMFFTSKDTGYVCGEWGELLKTTDAGQSWFEPDGAPRSFAHYNIHFINNDTGFMAHESGYVYRTLNGGANWSAFSAFNVLISNMHSIDFTNQLNGCAVGDYGVIYQTLDCGETWSCNSTCTDLDFREAFFLNRDTGFIITMGAVFKTLDGGDSWITLNLQGMNSVYNGIVFSDPDTGYIPSSSGRLIKTNDGGMTWNYIYTGFSENTNYYNLNIPGHDTLYVLGYKHILRSIDEGTTWTEIFTTQYSGGNLYFFSNNAGVFKYDTLVYQTKDAGQTWSSYGNAPEGWAYFINTDTGYILPGNGFLYHTTDGGFSWENMYHFDIYPTDLFFTNAKNGYACSYLGTIYTTKDAGYTWTKTEIGTERTFNFINFPDTTVGYAGGEGGMLLKYTAPLPVSVNENHIIDDQVHVFPNPFREDFKVSFILDIKEDAEIILFDLSGKILQEFVFKNLQVGSHTVSIPGKSLAPGVYLLRFNSGCKNVSLKIIKY